MIDLTPTRDNCHQAETQRVHDLLFLMGKNSGNHVTRRISAQRLEYSQLLIFLVRKFMVMN